MIYKNFQNRKLSALGLGTMRLPVVDGKDAQIDKERTAEMVDYALKNGVNYFDTAWGYHAGNSEPVIGEILSKYPRDSYYLASKFPGYDLANMPKVREIFPQQLERCRVEYFDFYLFHNVNELNIDAYLDPQYGIYDYLVEQKRNGRIRHLGFSGHGNLEVLKRFLEKYGPAMEFGQLQINWLDWEFQHAKDKVELFRSYGIPVWVMEPLRGGKLAKLNPDLEEKLAAMRPEETTPGMGFRFLQSIPDVTVTLSGMSNMEQLRQNIETFREERPLSHEETLTLLEMGRAMTGAVPCTACRYCTTHCPQELDIPHLLSIYNEHTFSGGGFLPEMALQALPEEKKPWACVGCRSCEQVCPQNIRISEALADFSHKLKK